MAFKIGMVFNAEFGIFYFSSAENIIKDMNNFENM